MGKYKAALVGLTGISAGTPGLGPDVLLGGLMPHSHAAAYVATPSVTLVAGCDLLPQRCEEFLRAWSPRLPHVRAYSDYREMLDRERPDLLSVATPDHRHTQIVVDAAEGNVRGIYCEKPIATTLAEADRMIAVCRERGVALLINHTRRWFAEYLEARRLVREGAIGPLQRLIATLGGQRAMLFRNGTHLIDTVCFFAESDPDWVVGELDDERHDYGPRYAGDGGHDPGTDPGASGYVHFRNGVRAFINASQGTVRDFELELIGPAGRIRIGNNAFELWRLMENGQPAVTHLQGPHTMRGDMVAAVAELITLVEHGGRPSASGEDGRRALSIALAILQSSAAGCRRVDFPIQDA